MILLLWALTVFNAAAAFAGFGLAMRLMLPEERAHWRSPRLLRIAEACAWVLPVAALVGTALAWTDVEAGRPMGALLGFIPFAWLVLMGLVFAIVDFAEDGILGNARKS